MKIVSQKIGRAIFERSLYETKGETLYESIGEMIVVGGKMLFAVIAAGLFVQGAFAHGNRFEHAKDMQKVFDGYEDENLRQFYAKFSSCIDTGPNSVEKRIRKGLAEKFPGQKIKLTEHRYVAHSWFYGGAIPDLTLLERRYPGCKEVIVDVWRKFCNENNSTIEREFGLYGAPKIASAYCSMLYYTHLLGDWDPRDNTDSSYSYLMLPKDIVEQLIKACKDMFGRSSHSDYCGRFEAELRKALQSKVVKQDQGVAIMQALWSLKVGTELHNTFAGKGLDETRHPWADAKEGK